MSPPRQTTCLRLVRLRSETSRVSYLRKTQITTTRVRSLRRHRRRCRRRESTQAPETVSSTDLPIPSTWRSFEMTCKNVVYLDENYLPRLDRAGVFVLMRTQFGQPIHALLNATKGIDRRRYAQMRRSILDPNVREFLDRERSSLRSHDANRAQQNLDLRPTRICGDLRRTTLSWSLRSRKISTLASHRVDDYGLHRTDLSMLHDTT